MKKSYSEELVIKEFTTEMKANKEQVKNYIDEAFDRYEKNILRALEPLLKDLKERQMNRKNGIINL